jgi:hypothetical protein
MKKLVSLLEAVTSVTPSLYPYVDFPARAVGSSTPASDKINDVLLNQILPSIQEGGYLIFYYEKYFCENYEILKNILIENNINFTINSNLLEHINIEDRLIKESEYLFNNEFIKITNG